jgi:hypothetical protein
LLLLVRSRGFVLFLDQGALQDLGEEAAELGSLLGFDLGFLYLPLAGAEILGLFSLLLEGG